MHTQVNTSTKRAHKENTMSTVDDQINELKELTQTYTNVDLAKALGTTRNTIQTWKSRGKVPERVMQEMRLSSQKKTHTQQDGMVSLTYYDIEASAGHGSLVEVETATELSFTERYLRDELHVNPTEVFTMRAKGDSMYPALKDGSIMMVHRITDFSGDGVYVFRVNGQVMVKRLQFQPTKIIFKSDNSQFYEPWELTHEEIESTDFEILGRVIWAGGKI